MQFHDMALAVKQDSFTLAALSEEARNQALEAIATALLDNQEAIFKANALDLAAGQDLPAPILGRLKFDQHKLQDCVTGIRDLQGLPDPLFRVTLHRQLAKDLVLKQVTCPIGVIGVIFESRPDALEQISSLCQKSGN